MFSFQGCIPIVNLAERPEKIHSSDARNEDFPINSLDAAESIFWGGKPPFTQDDPRLNRGLRFL